MGAKYKDYAYSDNAQVLKNRVNNVPSPSENSTTGDVFTPAKNISIGQFSKREMGKPTARDVSIANSLTGNKSMRPITALAKDIGEDMDERRSMFPNGLGLSATESSRIFNDDKQRLVDTASIYDRWRGTTFGASDMVNAPTSPSSPVGPAKFAMDQTSLRSSAMRPKEGQLLLSQDATGRVGWFGADGRPAQSVFDAAPGLPAGSALASSSNNYTSRFQADSDIFKAQIAALNRGEPIGPMYTPQGQPGPGTYQQDSIMDRLSQKRDALSKSVLDMNASSGISSSSSVSDIIAHQMKTKSLRDEIKSIDTQLLGRSDLANKIQLAILQNLGAQTVQGMKESGDDRRTAANNDSLFDIHSMREKMETGRSVMDNMSAERVAAGRLAADDAAAKQKASEKNMDFVNGINKDAMMKIIEASIPKDGGPVDPKSIAELTRNTYREFYPDAKKKDEMIKGIL